MSAQAEKKPGSKHDAFIRDQLARVRGRVRLLDLMAGGLGLVAGLLAFVCLMVALDAALTLSAATRQFAMLLFLSGVGFYLWVAVLRPLRLQVNPRFAARELEKTLPSSRNRVVSWIDLEDEKLPGIFRAGLSSRAAHDLQEADLDEAIPAGRVYAVAALAAGLLALFVLLLVLFGPRPFASLLGRAFGFSGAIARRTRVSIVKPGDHVATIGTPVTIVARVEGRIPDLDDPDAPCLIYRHTENEPARKRLLARDAVTGEWHTLLAAAEVGNGFLYRVTAGDDETDEYTVTTRAAPLLADFVAVYRYRAYVGRGDVTRTRRKLDDLRGTAVTITARANRAVASARLQIDGAGPVPGEVLSDDPRRVRFRLVLDRPGRYKLGYTAQGGETFTDAQWHEIAVQDDIPPAVVLTRPGKDITAPVNGSVELEGEATDDHGVAGLTLRLAVEGGAKLAGRPYLEKPLRAAPSRRIGYREVLSLAELKLKPGAKIEYWLEASDACEFPKANVSRTQSYFITLEGKKDEAGQKKQEEQARAKKAEHDKKQQEQLKQEAKAREEKKKKEDSQAKQDAGAKPGEKQGGADKDDETKKQADQLRGAMEKSKAGKEKKEDRPGEGKGAADEKPGEKKGGDKDKKPGQAKGGAEGKGGEKAGEKKGGGDAGPPKPPESKGAGKDEGKKEGKDKPGGKKEGGGNKKGEAKSGPGPKGEKKGSNKPGGEGRPPGEGKGGDARPGDAKGEGKPAAPKDGKPGEGKPPPSKPGSKGEGKPGGPAPGKPDEAGKSKGKADTGKPGQGKPSGEGPAGKAESKGGKGGKPADATKDDVRDLADQAKAGGMAGEEAKRGLEAIRDQATDPQARQAAADALGAGEGKAEGKGPGKMPPTAEGKGGTPDMGQAAGKAAGKEAGAGKADGGKAKPGAGKGENTGGGDIKGPPLPARKEKPRAARASLLQLEDFKKRVDAGILKDAKMSREQFARFLRDYEDLARREQARPVDPNDVKTGGASSLPTTGGGAEVIKDRPGDQRGTGTPKPPSEYRDSYGEFLRRLNRR